MLEPDETESAEPANEEISFSLTISLDRESFFRRECPSCGLEFKTEGNPADFAWALEMQLRRVSDEVGVDSATVVQEKANALLGCPYCSHKAELAEMHTAETTAYLKRVALREYALPKLHDMLEGFADRIGNRRSGGGFISVTISANYDRPPLPPRAIYGPDAPDMMVVHFLCCDKKLKVAEGWTNLSSCPYCETEVAIA